MEPYALKFLSLTLLALIVFGYLAYKVKMLKFSNDHISRKKNLIFLKSESGYLLMPIRFQAKSLNSC